MTEPLTCAPHVKCPKCKGGPAEAIHFPRYIELRCTECGFVWSQK